MSSSAGPEYFASHRLMPPEAVQRIEHCAFHLGETYDSYLVTENNREYFFSSGGRGVVGFRRWGRNVQVVGGLLAESADQEPLLLELLAFARERRWRLTFFNVDRNGCRLFRRHGFEITKYGEEPIVRLDRTDWKGPGYEWLRRQEKHCWRQGVVVREICAAAAGDVYAARIAPELESISREHLAGTVHGREMQYFVGQFEPFALGRRRLFVAQTPQRIECFVVINPCLAGSMWAIEMFRRRRDAVRGVLPFAMLQTIKQLQAERVQFCSLSLIPWLRCDTAQTGDSWRLRSTASWLWHSGNALYDVRGMYHFKSRFRPHYREMYVASLPRISWSAIVGIGMSWGLLQVNPLRVFSHWWRDRWDPHRRSLAEPPWRPERVVRDLKISDPDVGGNADADAASADSPTNDARPPVPHEVQS